MSLPIAFLICTEPGRLEKQSLFLVESIRKFGGNMKDTPIYSIHPRKGEPISSKTKKAFESLGVFHEQIILNTDYHEYYLANKIVSCAYAEQNINSDILVWLDSDKCIFSEPKEFFLPLNYSIGVRPETGKGVGSTGEGDIQDSYWRKIYEVCDVKSEIFVNTLIGNTKVRGYWNSGMVAVKRNAGIFTAWKNNFAKVMKLQIAPPQGIYFVEQSVLAATLCSLEENIFTFSPSYNYPLPLHNRLSKAAKLKKFDELVSIHYFNMFFYNDWEKSLDKLKGIDKSSDKFQWLCESICRHQMPHQPIIHKYLLSLKKVEKKLQLLKINLNLSGVIERIIGSS
jgi:hypothetical protein